jgi:hypothetical protein
MPIEMNKIWRLFLLFAILLSCKGETETSAEVTEPMGSENVAYKWGHLALEATALDTERFTPRPTVTSRYLGLIFTAVFDAWSRYDPRAIPVYLDGVGPFPTRKSP